MRFIVKLYFFAIYWSFGYIIIGPTVNYSIWGILWAVPVGIFLGATWAATEWRPTA